MANEEPGEDELERRQAAGLYPVGRALRATFDAENHDSLGTDLTGLMLELARIDPNAAPVAPAAVAMPLPAATPAPVEQAARVSWWRVAAAWLMARLVAR